MEGSRTTHVDEAALELQRRMCLAALRQNRLRREAAAEETEAARHQLEELLVQARALGLKVKGVLDEATGFDRAYVQLILARVKRREIARGHKAEGVAPPG